MININRTVRDHLSLKEFPFEVSVCNLINTEELYQKFLDYMHFYELPIKSFKCRHSVEDGISRVKYMIRFDEFTITRRIKINDQENLDELINYYLELLLNDKSVIDKFPKEHKMKLLPKLL